MAKVLALIDGSEHSNRAIKYLLGLAKEGQPLQLQLLNVQPPIESGLVREFISSEQIRRYHEEEGAKALAFAKRRLRKAGIPYEAHVKVGHFEDVFADHMRRKRCNHIVMGTRGLGSVEGMILGSIATKVVHLATVPVTLVK